MDREEFIKSLYDDSEEELKSVYTAQKENEAKILNQIAMILLTYNIVDSALKLTNKEKSDNYSKLSNLILNMFGKEIKSTTNGITNILSDVVKKDLNSYGLKSHKDEVLKIIDGHYKGKHFSDRVWDNENQVSKMIHKEIKDFLDGKVNVNQIKSHIENQFNSNKYNVKRLVDSEIGNIESKITEKYFKDYKIKRVRYNATLCNTCEKCISYHEKVFDIDDNSRPSLPQHAQCHCFYVQEDDLKSSGALSGGLNPESKEADKHAIQYYESVRKMKNDVNKISQNTGLSTKMIDNVKKHIFYNEHNLGHGIIGKFDPDYDMAIAWQRLIDGKNIKDSDIILLNHEYLEFGLMKRYNYEYKVAHEITERKYNYSKAIKKERSDQ